MLEDAGRRKTNHHGLWCLAIHNRAFVAIPGTTLGSIGHDAFWDFFDTTWDVAIAREVAGGGSGDDLRRRKQDTLAELHAEVIRYTADHIITMSGRF